ncbi:hypothetical protein ABZV95_29740, partial [Streptomyces albidoflavus]
LPSTPAILKSVPTYLHRGYHPSQEGSTPGTPPSCRPPGLSGWWAPSGPAGGRPRRRSARRR